MDKKPKCPLCRGKAKEDNLFRWLPDLDKKGKETGSGKLAHQICFKIAKENQARKDATVNVETAKVKSKQDEIN